MSVGLYSCNRSSRSPWVNRFAEICVSITIVPVVCVQLPIMFHCGRERSIECSPANSGTSYVQSPTPSMNVFFEPRMKMRSLFEML